MQLSLLSALSCLIVSGQTLKIDTPAKLLSHKSTQLILEDLPWTYLSQNTTGLESRAASEKHNLDGYPSLEIFHDGPNATGRTQRIIRNPFVLQSLSFAQPFVHLDLQCAEALIRKPILTKSSTTRTSSAQLSSQTTSPIIQDDTEPASTKFRNSLEVVELETTSAAPNNLVLLPARRTFSKMAASLAVVFLIFLFWL